MIRRLGIGKFALLAALCLSLVVPLTAFADGGPSAVVTVSSTAASTSSSPGSSNRLPLFYAVARSGPFSLSGAPGATVGPVNISFENFGLIPWTSTRNVRLHSSATGSFFGLGTPVSQGGCDGLRLGGTCTWQITYTLGSTAGTFTDNWQMYVGRIPFGQKITVTITIT